MGIRSRNCNWRMAALKSITQLFHAFDRINYARYLPLHIGQIAGLPDYILHHFQMGGFASSIKGNNFSCTAPDESHESLINKDTKSIIVRNPPSEINKLACTIEFQAEMINHYFGLIGAIRNNLVQRDYARSVIQKEQQLVLSYAVKFEKSFIFDQHENITPLYKAFSRNLCSTIVETDLMNYAKRGKESNDIYVRSSVIRDSSGEIRAAQTELAYFH